MFQLLQADNELADVICQRIAYWPVAVNLCICLSVLLCLSLSASVSAVCLYMCLCVCVFSYMGGTNFWGGTKENDVSLMLYILSACLLVFSSSLRLCLIRYKEKH